MVLLAYLFNRSLRSLDRALNAAEEDLIASVRRLESAYGSDFQCQMMTYWRKQQSARGLARNIKSSLLPRGPSTDVSAEVKDLDE